MLSQSLYSLAAVLCAYACQQWRHAICSIGSRNIRKSRTNDSNLSLIRRWAHGVVCIRPCWCCCCLADMDIGLSTRRNETDIYIISRKGRGSCRMFRPVMIMKTAIFIAVLCGDCNGIQIQNEYTFRLQDMVSTEYRQTYEILNRQQSIFA